MAIRIEDLDEPGQVLKYPKFRRVPIKVPIDNIVRNAADLAQKLAGRTAPLDDIARRFASRASEIYDGARDGIRKTDPIKGEIGASNPRRQIRETERAVQHFEQLDASIDRVLGATGEPDLTTSEPDFGGFVDRARGYIRGAAEEIGKAQPR